MGSPSSIRHAQSFVLFLVTLGLIQAKRMEKESKGDMTNSQEIRKESKREKTGRTKIKKREYEI